MAKDFLRGGFKYFWNFHPGSLGKWSNLTSIFFKWLEPPISKLWTSKLLGPVTAFLVLVVVGWNHQLVLSLLSWTCLEQSGVIKLHFFVGGIKQYKLMVNTFEGIPLWKCIVWLVNTKTPDKNWLRSKNLSSNSSTSRRHKRGEEQKTAVAVDRKREPWPSRRSSGRGKLLGVKAICMRVSYQCDLIAWNHGCILVPVATWRVRSKSH